MHEAPKEICINNTPSREKDDKQFVPAAVVGIGASTPLPEPGGVILSRNQQEKELVDRFIKAIGKVFVQVDREVWDASGKSRIDLVVYITKDVMFGIEFKRDDERKHGNKLGAWLNQARRYSTSLFKNKYTNQWGLIPVFVYPAITYTNLIFNPDVHAVKEGVEQHEHNNVNSFIYAAFGVGELRVLSKKRLIFSINCYNVADICKKASGWVLYFHENKHRILMEQINKSTACPQ